MPIGTEINNDANIYFDFNLPILTNNAQTVIYDFDLLSAPVYEFEDIAIYPNPTNGQITIKSNNFKKVDIYNINGSLLKTAKTQKIDLSNFSKGVYFAKVTTNQGTTTKKIILQ